MNRPLARSEQNESPFMRLCATNRESCARRRDASATPSQLAGPVLPDELVAEAVVTFDAKARRNYAGTSPITKTSGTRRVVLARYARNRRLADALHQQAFAALNGSPGARAFYDHHRARGATHHQALRALANRLVGILDGCLRHRTNYDEATALNHRATVAA